LLILRVDPLSIFRASHVCGWRRWPRADERAGRALRWRAIV